MASLLASMLMAATASAALGADSLSLSAVEVTATDESGALLPGAELRLACKASAFQSTGITGDAGKFRFEAVPVGECDLRVSAPGFASIRRPIVIGPADAQIRLPLVIAGGKVELLVSDSSPNSVAVEPVAVTKLGQDLVAKLPTGGSSSSFSTLLTLGVAGVSGDANGVFHVLGEHAEASFHVDGQPISDQQSRVFSNQLALGAIESIEVLNGSPPAEFGDKTSVLVKTTTRSGLGRRKPTGSLSSGYGSFGSPSASVALGYGGDHFGNFLCAEGLVSGRFLDTPELSPLHAHGNSTSLFDRFDYQPSSRDAFHVNLTAARSWSQTPNDYDQQAAGQDQRQQNKSLGIAPAYTRVLNPKSLLEGNLWLRHDQSRYFPSRDLLADKPAFLSQSRRLTNAGGRAAMAYANGRHTLKTGVDIHFTALSENFQTGLTDPLFNSPCLHSNGAAADTQSTDPNQCATLGLVPNDAFLPALLAVDLNRGGSLFRFQGDAGIFQQAAFFQDAIRLGSLSLNLGLRYDHYDGITQGLQWQPRVGVSYQSKLTRSVFRFSYARVFLTPYNENLVLASSNGPGPVNAGALGAQGGSPLTPAYRNQYNTGFQQAVGKWLIVDGEYFWKYTRGAYDFDVILNTPLNFPVQFRLAKVDGVMVRLSTSTWHGLSVYSVLGHSRSRLFGPETGGVRFSAPYADVVRPDHDQAFQQTAHVRYQHGQNGAWAALTWRFESGLVSVATPDFATALRLTGDQQAQMGLYCGDRFATPSSAIRSCDSTTLGATRVRIPPSGTENDDTNPPRIAMRNTFDLGIGHDDLLRTDRYKLRFRFNVANLTGVQALYNFLSSFSGTHFIPPRSYQAELALVF